MVCVARMWAVKSKHFHNMAVCVCVHRELSLSIFPPYTNIHKSIHMYVRNRTPHAPLCGAVAEVVYNTTSYRTQHSGTEWKWWRAPNHCALCKDTHTHPYIDGCMYCIVLYVHGSFMHSLHTSTFYYVYINFWKVKKTRNAKARNFQLKNACYFSSMNT